MKEKEFEGLEELSEGIKRGNDIIYRAAQKVWLNKGNGMLECSPVEVNMVIDDIGDGAIYVLKSAKNKGLNILTSVCPENDFEKL